MFRNHKKQTFGLIDGSFDPLHKAHIHFIQQALLSCDQLYVLVENNPPKDQLHLPISERVKLIEDVISDSRVQVIAGNQPLSKPYNSPSRKLSKNYFLSQFPSKTRVDKYYTLSKEKAFIADIIKAQWVKIPPEPSLPIIPSSAICEDFTRYSHLLPHAVKERYLEALKHEGIAR